MSKLRFFLVLLAICSFATRALAEVKPPAEGELTVKTVKSREISLLAAAGSGCQPKGKQSSSGGPAAGKTVESGTFPCNDPVAKAAALDAFLASLGVDSSKLCSGSDSCKDRKSCSPTGILSDAGDGMDLDPPVDDGNGQCHYEATGTGLGDIYVSAASCACC